MGKWCGGGVVMKSKRTLDGYLGELKGKRGNYKRWWGK